MLEYSQGFWYRHHAKPSRESWWAFVDGYRWWIMVGVCFVGLLLYWAFGAFFDSGESTVSPAVSPSPTTIADPWTRADGEWGAFTQSEPILLAGPPYVSRVSQTAALPVQSISSLEQVTPTQDPVFFEEPDFVCEYLAHPVAFHHCAAMGEKSFVQRYFSRSLSDPLPVSFWNAVLLEQG